MNPTKTIAASLLASAALLAAGCGGSDDSTSTEASSDSGAPYDITVGEWVADLEAEKTEILEAYVADNPSCNADPDRGFLLQLAAVSTDFDPSTPLPEMIKKYC